MSNLLSFKEEIIDVIACTQKEYDGQKNHPAVTEQYKYHKLGVIEGMTAAKKLYESKEPTEEPGYIRQLISLTDAAVLSIMPKFHDQKEIILFDDGEDVDEDNWFEHELKGTIQKLPDCQAVDGSENDKTAYILNIYKTDKSEEITAECILEESGRRDYISLQYFSALDLCALADHIAKNIH